MQIYSRLIRSLLLLSVVAAGLGSCTVPKDRDLQQEPVVGLTSPFQLQHGVDTLYVQDYILEPASVDSVEASGPLEVFLDDDHSRAVIKGNLEQPIGDLAFWIGGSSYHLPLYRPVKKQLTLSFKPDRKYEEVLVKGEMNNWTPSRDPMSLEEGVWKVDMTLRPGTYEYLFVVDGEEILDPANDHIVPNGMGGQNSVLTLAGPGEDQLPSVHTSSFTDHTVKLKTRRSDGLIAYWQNEKISGTLNEGEAMVDIPGDAARIKRSFLRVWTYNDSGYSNDLLIPLHYGKVVNAAAQLSRDDWEKTVMYFMMIDRFKNGNPENDKKVDDPEILPEANYYGGDLEGVTRKIKEGYFDSLGVNALWLSPITQNPEGAYGLFPDPKTKFSGYHGYWPISSTKVDHRFGSEEELRELLGEAHRRDMNVILDYVANHVHELHPVYKEHPEWATDLYLEEGTMNTENWDSHRLTTWFDTFMPTLDFSRPEVVETMTDSALFWLSEYQFDGFRHDATKHIQLDFWRTLTRKLKKEVVVPKNKRIYQIGETYGSPALIASYINTGMLDGQFDFNVYDDAVAVFAREDQPMSRLASSLEESLQYYGYHNLMGYITGNQDRARFISYAGGALSFDEDAKVAGWNREIGVGDPSGYEKLKMLLAFNMTIPGIPMIYYGDEIGMPGGNDPDNRKMMRFDNLGPQEQQVRKTTSRLAGLRTDRLSLVYGDFQPLLVTEDQYAYARNYFEEWTAVVFNNSANSSTVVFEMPKGFTGTFEQSIFGGEFKQEGRRVEIELPPYGFSVLATPKLQ